MFDDFKVVWLEQNLRQKDDQPWCHLLDRIRIGELIDGDLATLMTRVRQKDELETMQDEGKIAMRLYPVKTQVAEFNSAQQNKLNANTLTFECADIYSMNDINAGCTADPRHIPKDDRDAGGLMQSLTLSIGSRVMLTRNLTYNLINGDMGILVRFGHDEYGTVDTIYVKFDDPNIGEELKLPDDDEVVPIEKVSTEYHHYGRFIERTQFCLMPAWSLSIHKAQGLSLDSAAMHVGDKIFQRSMIYVALSRVRKLEGVYIEPGEKTCIKLTMMKPNDAVLEWSANAKQNWNKLKVKIDKNKDMINLF